MPLHVAIKAGASMDTVLALLKRRCPIDARDPATQHSALECVLACGLAGSALFDLIQREMQVLAPTSLHEAPGGPGPLHVAVANNALARVVDHLVATNPQAVIAQDNDQRLPIHLACQRGATCSVIRILLKSAPGTVKKKDGRGRTPLQLAVTHNAQPGVCLELIRVHREEDKKEGKETRVLMEKDAQGRTPLQQAVCADAPTWIIHELMESMPVKELSVNLLDGRWPNTRAAAEVSRMIPILQNREQEKRKQDETTADAASLSLEKEASSTCLPS